MREARTSLPAARIDGDGVCATPASFGADAPKLVYFRVREGAHALPLPLVAARIDGDGVNATPASLRAFALKLVHLRVREVAHVLATPVACGKDRSPAGGVHWTEREQNLKPAGFWVLFKAREADERERRADSLVLAGAVPEPAEGSTPAKSRPNHSKR